MGKACSRCAGPIGEHWTSQWPIACRIVIGRHSQIFNEVSGGDWDAMCKHPAVVDGGAQRLIVEWYNQALPPREWAGKKRDDDRGGVSGTVDGAIFGGPRFEVTWPEYEEAEKDKKFREPRWAICEECHDAFIRLIGGFLGLRSDLSPHRE